MLKKQIKEWPNNTICIYFGLILVTVYLGESS